MPDWSCIAEQLDAIGWTANDVTAAVPVSGGDISAAWQLSTSRGDVFVKTGPLSGADMFAAESDGLTAILASGTLRVPGVVLAGKTASDSFLALEWLILDEATIASDEELGEQLALLHEVTQQQYGWHRDNTIGLTPQVNTYSDNWLDFFRRHRLGCQLKLAAQNGYTGEIQDRGAQLMKRLPIYFDNEEQMSPALLHGDLWSGNRAAMNGCPIVFDPAVYYGDRESDIAMTRLFGGFDQHFYAAYESRWPRRDGYQERQCLYQLYHVLNHVNLFGSAYLRSATKLINRLL